MKHFNKLGSLVAATMIAAGLGFAGPAAADTFKLATATPLNNPESLAAQRFAKLVAERSDGRITVDVVVGGAAGGEREIAEALQFGTMHMAVLGGIVQNFDPALMVVEWDLLFKSNEHVRAAMYGEVGDLINQRLVDNVGVRNLAVLMRTPRLLTTNVPVETLADLDGLKIRVPEMPARVAIWSELGARPTPMAFPDVVPALQLGTIDGQENPIGLIHSAGIHEAVDYLADTEHLYGFMMLLVAEPVWQGLSAEDQELLQTAAREAAEFNDELVAESEAEIKAKVTEGMTVTNPDVAEWRERTKDVYQQFSDTEGFVEIYEGIVEIGEQY
jgi:TRAP-type transport system periplasmic protein